MKHQEIVTKLQNDSTYFSQLKPQQQLYIAYYCTNGFNQGEAAKATGAKSASKFVKSDIINKATEEFMKEILVDRLSSLESRILDVLWTRAFYDPMEIIDEEGQPRFDINDYKEVLGKNSVVIEGFKHYKSNKDPNISWVEVQLADRNKALKELSTYIGMSHEDASGPATFTVNVELNNPAEGKVVPNIVEYKKPQII